MTTQLILEARAPFSPKTKPTKESVLAEAAMLGDAYSDVTAHPADLVADAEEMLQVRADAADLQRRGYDVNDFLFEKLAVLTGLLAPSAVQGKALAEASKLKTAQAEGARQRLLEIRAQLSAIGVAAGLPPGLFSLETRSTSRLNVVMMRMEEALLVVSEYQSRLPDPERVAALVTEARTLIDQHKQARRDSKMMRGDRSLTSDAQGRLERLLLDSMQHLSRQGLAAFPNDPKREAAYRLDHVYGRKSSRVKDPDAGGETGASEA